MCIRDSISSVYILLMQVWKGFLIVSSLSSFSPCFLMVSNCTTQSLNFSVYLLISTSSNFIYFPFNISICIHYNPKVLTRDVVNTNTSWRDQVANSYTVPCFTGRYKVIFFITPVSYTHLDVYKRQTEQLYIKYI